MSRAARVLAVACALLAAAPAKPLPADPAQPFSADAAQQPPADPAPQSPAERVARAVADYRAGRYAAAFATLQAELASHGGAAAPEVRWNTALAALRVQRSGDAEAAVEPWLAEPAGDRRADAEFVRALASCQRAERAALAAGLPDAEPTAWTMAVSSMQRAVAAFRLADEHRGGWPAARANAARAERRLRELQDAARRAAQATQQESTPPPEPPPTERTEPSPEAATPEAVVEPLTPQEVAGLVRRLQQKDRAKRALRQAEQRAAVSAGARGW